MKISVTQQHINDSLKENCRRCPIEKAIESLNKFDVIRVDYFDDRAEAYATLDGEFYELPQICYDFMIKFDGDLASEPFEFELNLNN